MPFAQASTSKQAVPKVKPQRKSECTECVKLTNTK